MARPYLGGSTASSVSKTASFSLVPADNGKTFVLSGGAVTITLPTLAGSLAGFSFKYISDSTHNHVITGGASVINYKGNYGSDHATNTGSDVHQDVSTLTLNDGERNDMVECWTNGTRWYCQGSTLATMDASS
tara:strand:+ start:195 stop:593 length:399 start_codon:yes stop_codon:yes gene_type:complete